MKKLLLRESMIIIKLIFVNLLLTMYGNLQSNKLPLDKDYRSKKQ